MAEILEIKNLNVRFAGRDGGVSAVNGLDFSVREGSFTALVGESGSGKSVTALSICRLAHPQAISGNIYFKTADGRREDLLALSEKALFEQRGRAISYVFQHPGSSLNPVMRVGEQVAEAYEAHAGAGRKEAQARAKKYLAAVKLGDVERAFRSFPHELSGGMRQRAMIAMALITEPRLLIADEPTTALDVTTEAGILELLASLRREKGLSIFFITHDLALAAAYADTIGVMEKGRLVEKLEKSDGAFHPREPYSKKLMAAALGGEKPKTFLEV